MKFSHLFSPTPSHSSFLPIRLNIQRGPNVQDHNGSSFNMINRESIHHHQNETSKPDPDRNVDSCSVRLMAQRELGVWRHTFSVCEQESCSARILFTTRCASRHVASVCFGSVRTQGNCGISHVTSLLSYTFNGSLNQQTFTSYTRKNRVQAVWVQSYLKKKKKNEINHRSQTFEW